MQRRDGSFVERPTRAPAWIMLPTRWSAVRVQVGSKRSIRELILAGCQDVWFLQITLSMQQAGCQR